MTNLQAEHTFQYKTLRIPGECGGLSAGLCNHCKFEGLVKFRNYARSLYEVFRTVNSGLGENHTVGVQSYASEKPAKDTQKLARITEFSDCLDICVPEQKKHQNRTMTTCFT